VRKHYGRNVLKWKEDSLFFQDKKLVSFVPDDVWKDMFRLQWPEGDCSDGFYNKTRAKEHCYKFSLRIINEDTIEE
jgi:hypothetical protein